MKIWEILALMECKNTTQVIMFKLEVSKVLFDKIALPVMSPD